MSTNGRRTVRWQDRRTLALLVDVGVLIAPILTATVTIWALSPALTGMPLVWRLTLLLAAAAVIASGTERLGRRLLPLAALLRLTMVFPDRPPSRFAVARQAGNPRVLLERLQSSDVDEAQAAGMILSLVAALRAHDRHTRGHSERVRAYTDLLSEELGLPEAARDRLRWSALLHDIGKLRISTDILNKPGKPTASQWASLKQHPHHGEDIARALLPWLGEWGDAIVQHHERYDGTGYPAGLRGHDVCFGARIISVVDSFETMTAVRAYKKAISHKAAREELARCAGSQFDPFVVRAFLSISVPRVLWAMGPLSALLQLPFVNAVQFAGTRAAGLAGAGAGAVAPALAVGAVTTAAVTSPAAASTTHHHVHRTTSAQRAVATHGSSAGRGPVASRSGSTRIGSPQVPTAQPTSRPRTDSRPVVTPPSRQVSSSPAPVSRGSAPSTGTPPVGPTPPAPPTKQTTPPPQKTKPPKKSKPTAQPTPPPAAPAAPPPPPPPPPKKTKPSKPAAPAPPKKTPPAQHGR